MVEGSRKTSGATHLPYFHHTESRYASPIGPAFTVLVCPCRMGVGEPFRAARTRASPIHRCRGLLQADTNWNLPSEIWFAASFSVPNGGPRAGRSAWRAFYRRIGDTF